MTALLIAGCGVALTGTPSSADVGEPPNATNHPKGPPKSPSPATIQSQVHYKKSYRGAGVQMTAPAGSDWSPPACWYEPEFTPKQFSDYINGNYRSQESAWATMAKDYGADDFNKGKKGAWYQLIDNGDGADAYCAALDPWTWITPGKPSTPDVPSIDPKTLAGLAFNQTILPPPDITLRPDGKNQLVNLDTEIAFDKALPKVSVTASLDNAALGVHVAATTSAVPVQLTIDAGTQYADPQTCTYDLKDSGGTYSVDTKDAGCNVTYRKAGGYELKATVVWKVTWTPSANPDGPATAPALPNGQSSTPFSVTVRENEAVNR